MTNNRKWYIGTRSAEGEAVFFVDLSEDEKDAVIRGWHAGSEEGAERPGESDDEDKARDRYRHGQSHGGGIAGVRPVHVAGAHRFSAHHLDACREHAAERGENEEHRRSQAVSGNGVDPEESADHDIVDHHTDQDGHR